MLTKAHPYYTQLAFQQVVLANALDGGPPSEKKLLARLLAVEKDYIEKVWEDISTNKEYVETLLAVSKGGYNIYQRLKPTRINIARSLKKLEGMGILFKDKQTGY